MDTRIALHNIVNYFCDILEMPEGEPPERIQGRWGDVLRLAVEYRVYHYLAYWFLQHWQDSIPDILTSKLNKDLEANKARNAAIKLQIVDIARMFQDANIDVMFLKGAAGLIRGLYKPEQCRYMSDIDVLIHYEDIDKSRELITRHGYFTRYKRYNPKRTHHIEPYENNDNVAGVELHHFPVQYLAFNNKEKINIWDTSDSFIYGNQKLILPNVTYHLWILMRSDIFINQFFPLLPYIYEYYTLIENNTVDDRHLDKILGYYEIKNISEMYKNVGSIMIVNDDKYDIDKMVKISYMYYHLKRSSNKMMYILQYSNVLLNIVDNNILKKVKFVCNTIIYRCYKYYLRTINYLYKKIKNI